MSAECSDFRKPLIVIYGRGDLPEVAHRMIEVALPDSFVVRPEHIPPQDLADFCKENGGPSLVVFTNELMSGAKASEVMLKLRDLGINSLLMTDETTEPRARSLGLCTMPKMCSLAEFQIYLHLALAA